MQQVKANKRKTCVFLNNILSKIKVNTTYSLSNILNFSFNKFMGEWIYKNTNIVFSIIRY